MYNLSMKKSNMTKGTTYSDKEIFETIFKNGSVRIERIISNGQQSPKGFWYDQDEYEFVSIVEGYAVVEFENESVTLEKNDYIIIEPHKKHRVSYTSSPTVWLCIFFK